MGSNCWQEERGMAGSSGMCWGRAAPGWAQSISPSRELGAHFLHTARTLLTGLGYNRYWWLENNGNIYGLRLPLSLSCAEVLQCPALTLQTFPTPHSQSVFTSPRWGDAQGWKCPRQNHPPNTWPRRAAGPQPVICMSSVLFY